MSLQFKPTKNAAGHMVLEVYQGGECVLMLPSGQKYPALKAQARLKKQVPQLLRNTT